MFNHFSAWLDRKLGVQNRLGIPLAAMTVVVGSQLVGYLLLLAVRLGWRPRFVLLLR